MNNTNYFHPQHLPSEMFDFMAPILEGFVENSNSSTTVYRLDKLYPKPTYVNCIPLKLIDLLK